MNKSLLRAALACGVIALMTGAHAFASTIDFETQPAGPSVFASAGPAQTLVYNVGGVTVTFTGGVILTNESSQTTDNSNVYATGAVGIVGGNPSLQNPLLVTFSVPIQNFQIDILNALAGDYTLTDNAGHSTNFSLATTGGSIQTVGFAATGTQIAITSLGQGWDFAIDNVAFNQPLTNGSVPEPGSIYLLGTGALALLGGIRRKLF